LRHSVECGHVPNVMAALEIKVVPSVENDDERRKVWLTTPARVPCSNAANIAPYCENMWRGYCCLTNFFPIVKTCLVAKIEPDEFVRWCPDGELLAIFCVLYFS